eukprot:361940-Chlamydomonas_euryale.AAC.3
MITTDPPTSADIAATARTPSIERPLRVRRGRLHSLLMTAASSRLWHGVCERVSARSALAAACTGSSSRVRPCLWSTRPHKPARRRVPPAPCCGPQPADVRVHRGGKRGCGGAARWQPNAVLAGAPAHAVCA